MADVYPGVRDRLPAELAVGRERSGDAGTALLMILLALFSIGLMAMVLAQVATSELAITSNISASTVAFMPADGASEVMLRDLISMSRSLGRFPADAELATITPPTFTNVTLSKFSAYADGPEVARRLTGGLYVGLAALIQPFEIVVTADYDGPTPAAATVEIDGEFAAVPIFQFGVLYEYDLDVHPGPAMTLSGRMHSNADIYLDPGSSLTINAPITGDGNIYNRRAQGWASGGTVDILDASGTYREMAGLDSESPDWSAQALERWDGRVRSGDLGGDRLDLVIEDPTDPRTIIGAGRPDDAAADQAAKIWYQAGLRIVNGQGFDADGDPVSLIDPLTGTSAVRYDVIYDHREEQHMLIVELDMQKLGRTPGYPGNGTVYVGSFEPGDGMPAWQGGSPGVGPAEWSSYSPPWSSSSTEFAIKLRNGTELASSLTVLSENPVYIHGNYNTTNKKGAAVMADAITVLSNCWGHTGCNWSDPYDDHAHSHLALSDRDAGNTTVNAALMMGNVDMGTNYNGGLENLPRLLERWSGRTLTLNGSLVALWRSQYADGAFGKSGVYSAAIRDWYFDPDFLDLANLPPATPRIYQIRVTGWFRR